MTSEVVCLGARTVVKGRSMTSEVVYYLVRHL